MTKLTNYLIIISFDCLSSLDFPIIQEMPHFQELLNNGSYCTNVETIYPSITYPCHTTVITGKYPRRHGVINNTLLQPNRPSPDWYWYRRYIKGTTLYEEAKKSGLTTAALLWPVTAKANIDLNMPEIFANRPWQSQIAVSLLNGSPFYQLDMNRRFGHIRKGLSQPELDDFVLESTVHTIQSKKPNLLLVHFTDLDTQRHYHGFSSQPAHAALRRHDTRLGRIIQALKNSGMYKKTTIVVLGDHSALDESKAINLNTLLYKHHLIQKNRNGKIVDWKAYCKSCDGSAYLYVKDPNDGETKTTLRNLILDLMKDPQNGIEKALSSTEITQTGADENAFMMIEARRDFYFTEELTGSYIEPITQADVSAKKYTFAAHGYSPAKKDYKTILLASGKGIRPNVKIPYMRLVDEGPTFAYLLGLNLGNTDGHVIHDILAL